MYTHFRRSMRYDKYSKVALKTVVFMGSARNVVPPWGGEARLGDRVLKHVLSVLKARDEAYGQDRFSYQCRHNFRDTVP